MVITPSVAERGAIDISLGTAIRRLEDDLGLDGHGLAQALRVDRRTLGRWATGSTYPQTDARKRLQKLVTLHTALMLMWTTPDAARAWLHRPSPFLGHTEPIELGRAGRFDRVEAALEALASGFAS